MNNSQLWALLKKTSSENHIPQTLIWTKYQKPTKIQIQSQLFRAQKLVSLVSSLNKQKVQFQAIRNNTLINAFNSLNAIFNKKYISNFQNFVGQLDMFKSLEVVNPNLVIQENQDVQSLLQSIILQQTFPIFLMATCIRTDPITGEEQQFNIAQHFSSSKEVQQYSDNLLQKGSDPEYLEVIQYKIVGALQKEKTTPYIKINRSKVGQGSDFHSIQLVDNENLFIPESNNCLRQIVMLYASLNHLDTENIKLLFNEFCIENRICRDLIPQCKLRALSIKLGFYICPYSPQSKKIKYNNASKICDLLVVVYDNHYIQMKQKNMDCYKKIQNCYKKTISSLEAIHLSAIEYTKKSIIMAETTQEQIQNVLVWDLEANASSSGCQFKQYACGYTPIICADVSKKDFIINKINNLTNIFDGENCIIDMIANINNVYRKQTQTIKINNKKTNKVTLKKIMVKQDVYMYAHNSKGFDTFFVLQQAGLKFTKMIKPSGDIIQLTVSLENCNVHFRCTMSHLLGSLKSLCTTYQVPKELCKSELSFSEITEHNWQEKEYLWKPYLQLDIMSLAIVWRKYIENMHIVCQGISIKAHITLPSLVWSFLMKTKKVKLSSFDHPFMQQYLRKFVHGGKVMALKRKFRSTHLPEIQLILQQFYGTQSLETVSIIMNKTFQKLAEIKNTNIEIKPIINDDDLLNIKVAELLKSLHCTDVLMAFDANSLYPSAMTKIEAFPDISTSELMQPYDFKKLTNTGILPYKYLAVIDYVIPFNCYTPPLADKQNGVSLFHTGQHIKQHHCDLDVQEIYKFGGYITKVHEGVIFTKNIENPFIYLINTLFQHRLQAKIDKLALLDECYKLCMNSTYGKTTQKPILESYKFTTQAKFAEIFDESVISYEILNNGQVCYKIQHSCDEKPYPSILGIYILAMSKSIMNDFIISIGANNQNSIYYMDTDSIYVHKTHYQKLIDDGHVGTNLGQGKNDYGSSGIICADFVGPKQKLCYVLDDSGFILQKKTFKGVSKTNVNHEHFEHMQTYFDNVQLNPDFQQPEISVLESRWARSINSGVILGINNMSKNISAHSQLNKMNLVDNEFQLIHIPHEPRIIKIQYITTAEVTKEYCLKLFKSVDAKEYGAEDSSENEDESSDEDASGEEYGEFD